MKIYRQYQETELKQFLESVLKFKSDYLKFIENRLTSNFCSMIRSDIKSDGKVFKHREILMEIMFDTVPLKTFYYTDFENEWFKSRDLSKRHYRFYFPPKDYKSRIEYLNKVIRRIKRRIKKLKQNEKRISK